MNRALESVRRLVVWTMTPNPRFAFWSSLFGAAMCWPVAVAMLLDGGGWLGLVQLAFAIVFSLCLVAGIAQKHWRAP